MTAGMNRAIGRGSQHQVWERVIMIMIREQDEERK